MTYRISELAERTGFPASTLRYYEQQGLLPAVARTSGGYRSYDERALERLRFIARAKQLDLPLVRSGSSPRSGTTALAPRCSTGSPA